MSIPLHRVVIVGAVVAAVAAIGAMYLTGIPGSGSSAPSEEGRGDGAAASGRGAWLLNPYCRNVPPPGFDRPPNEPRVGRFDDAPYGYGVSIPPGVTAYVGPDRPPQGFGVLLSQDPRVFLRVDASYDVFYDITAEAVHRRDLAVLRLHDRLLDEMSTTDTLDGQPAGRYRMQFQCPGDAQVYIRDDLIVMRNREVYRLELQTVPARRARDEQLLDDVQRSWRWLAVPEGPKTAR